jgi:hypothetical protein
VAWVNRIRRSRKRLMVRRDWIIILLCVTLAVLLVMFAR